MKKSVLCGAVVAGCVASVAGADTVHEFTAFTASGGNFVQIFELGSLSGALTQVAGNFSLDVAGLGFTWADDLTLLLRDADGNNRYQFGGLNTQTGVPSTQRWFWGMGGSGNAGTIVNTTIPAAGIPEAIRPDMANFSVWLGNGYNAGGAGVWSGSVTMLGVVPAPGAIALLGVAGLVGSRRRRA